jgi:hypothetical protein
LIRHLNQLLHYALQQISLSPVNAQPKLEKRSIITMKCSVTQILLFLCLLMNPAHTVAVGLPDEFVIEVGILGVELVWSPNAAAVRIGGSRPEFRVSSGVILGYPREMNGTLHLAISSKEQDMLTTEGQSLEVWSSGRRLDSGSASNAFKVAAAASIATGYNAPPPKTPTVPTNPAQPGNYTTRRSSYNLANITVDEFLFPIEVLAEVTDPVRASGERPLILFLHGRHTTCYLGGPNGIDSGAWPCPDGWLPIPSHKGYRYVADILASQGYIVVSISANGINGQDFSSNDAGTTSRSVLIRHHLNLWAQWNTGGDPWGGRFRGRLDMTQVVLVGHSRGGEGVNRAAIDATTSDPYKIVGLVSYGPTAFGRQVTPDVHSATILPTCDGDVLDLQGQAYIDASRDIAYSEALRSAVIAIGANHNYFNTEWTPGLAKAPAYDDWFDDAEPACGGTNGILRITPLEQQAVGAAYTAALVKLAINQDITMLPLLDGSFVRPAAIGRAEVVISAVGGANYRLLYRPEDKGMPLLRNGMSGAECLGSTFLTSSLPLCRDGLFVPYATPHWQPITSRLSPLAMELEWTNQSGAIAEFDVSKTFTNLTAHDWVDIRIANDPDRRGVRFDILVSDKSGRNATLRSNMTVIQGWPDITVFGIYPLDRIHARTLRGSLTSVRSKVDLSSIVAVYLRARSASGRVWVLDVAASQARIEKPSVLDLPVISVETVSVPEGDGFKRYNLKITANKPILSPGSIWVETSDEKRYQVDFGPKPGTLVSQVPFEWIGDRVFTSAKPLTGFASIEAVKGAVTGNYYGSLTVSEDEPFPRISVTSRNVTATEGRSLRWTLNIPAATAGTTIFLSIIPPLNGTELSSSDVAPSWLISLGVTSPPTPVPLSSLNLFIKVTFDYGVKSADLFVPLTRDGQPEGEEVVVLQLANGFGFYDPVPETLIGTVRAH